MSQRSMRTLLNTATGIEGLDEVTDGGIPIGRQPLFAAVQVTEKRCLAFSFFREELRNTGSQGFRQHPLSKKILIGTFAGKEKVIKGLGITIKD